MDCNTIKEFLPWHLNGSLDAAQHESVRAHLTECPQCQQELDEVRFALSVSKQHIPETALMDYLTEIALPENERSLIERHLAMCADCTEQAAMVKESFALQQETARVLEFRPRAVSPKPLPVRLWQYGALAASLFGLLAAGGLWRSWQQNRSLENLIAQQRLSQHQQVTALEAENQRLRQMTPPNSSDPIARLETRIRELSAPQPNAPVLEIFPHELNERSQPAATTKLTIPTNARQVTLILNSQSAIDARQYQLKILDTQNRIVTSVAGLVRQPTGDYSISLPTELLPPGKYTVNIYGSVGGRRTKIESYSIQVARK